jgi:ribosomal protein L16 Arg81 hydroxylase
VNANLSENIEPGAMLRQLQKLRSLLTIKHSLAILRKNALTIDRCRRPSREEFLNSYFAMNRPVVLSGMLDDSDALSRWSPEYFADAWGDVTVEVMTDRDLDAKYEIRCEQHRTSMLLADYINRITSSGPSNDCYLVANNGFFERPEVAQLREEVPRLPGLLDESAAANRIFLWLGPAGTVTPLHHDVMNVLVAQIRGTKRFTLISPEQTPWVYNHLGVFSEVDCEAPDLARFPLFRNVEKLECELGPGEVLFIPVGWWHHVRALELSLSVTYTNFTFPNDFQWAHPGDP